VGTRKVFKVAVGPYWGWARRQGQSVSIIIPCMDRMEAMNVLHKLPEMDVEGNVNRPRGK